jgi:hypothetical protein
MVYTPQTYYRSESARQLSERVASGEGLNSLNVTVNVDQVLENRQSDVPLKVHEAIIENRNFVLFSDKSHYIIIIPCKLAVACYVNGKQETMEVMKDMHQFQNRVKIAFVVYGKFYELDRFIESGINGDGTLPNHTNRKDLQNGEKGTGESTTGVPE